MLFELLVIVLLVAANGLFAGAELALVGIDRIRVQKLVDEGRRGARVIAALRANPERLLATVQVVITVVSATASAFGGARIARDLAPLLTPSLGRHAEGVALGIVVGVVSYLSLVFGELVPKSLALRHIERYALFVAPVLASLSTAARPLVWMLSKSSNLVLRAFGDSTTFMESRVSPGELRDLVDEATETGSLNQQVGAIASRAFDFAELTAGHAMIPRTRIVGIQRGADAEEIRRVVLENAHSRLPIYGDDLDEIVGYVLYKDLVALAWERQLIVLSDLVRPPYFVSVAMPAATLLDEMRKRRVQLAFVLDEHGGTAGIVTLDDLVEELIGDVFSEIHAAAPSWAQKDATGAILAHGEVPVRELNREFDLELPERSGWTTVGGLCLFLAGGVPQPGTRLVTENGIALLVEKATARAVERVRITPAPPPEPG